MQKINFGSKNAVRFECLLTLCVASEASVSVQRRGGLLWGRNAGAFPPVGGRKHRPTDGCSERAATTQGDGSLFCQSPTLLCSISLYSQQQCSRAFRV